jgi:hypothetical protein
LALQYVRVICFIVHMVWWICTGVKGDSHHTQPDPKLTLFY